MSAKKSLLFIGALASSVLFVLPAGARDNRDDHNRGDRDRGGYSRDDRSGHERRASVRYHDLDRDRHYRTVWSRARPRPHFYANHMPPPRRHEWQPHRPSHRHVWISGYWGWNSPYGSWIWVDGYWALPPRATVVYVAPRYERVGTRVQYIEGGWCESDYANDGAVTGAVLGGVAGGIIGHQSKDTGLGVMIGALVGTVIGHQTDRQKADERSERIEIERNRAELQAKQDEANRVAIGSETSDEELAAAQDRARLAKERLAVAKAERNSDLARATALERANAEAEAAEAELRALGK